MRSSLFLLPIALFFAACSGSTGSGSTSANAGGSGGAGGESGIACTAAFGTCVAVTPDACPNGTFGDANMYSCGDGVGVGCCLPAGCTPGMDQTCNAILSMSSYAGKCNPDGTCTCTPPFVLNAEGKCGM
jgi:hypothetical protein